jgi:hypothetical protein
VCQRIELAITAFSNGSIARVPKPPMRIGCRNGEQSLADGLPAVLRECEHPFDGRSVLSGLETGFLDGGEVRRIARPRTAPGILWRRVASLTFSLLWQQKRVHDHNLPCEMRCGVSMDSTYCSKAAVSAAPSIIMDSPIPSQPKEAIKVVFLPRLRGTEPVARCPLSAQP